MRQVPTLLGGPLNVRTRASAVGAATTTWSAAVEITAQITQEQERIDHDSQRRVDVRKAMAVLIYSDTYSFPLHGGGTSNELPVGAEVQRPSGMWWAVVQRLPSTSGLKRALVERELPRQLTADRGRIV
jgi:hypothetical protein